MRSEYCGRINRNHLGQTVSLCGWVHRRRDHGGVIFIDLRDREGLVQIVSDPDLKETFSTADKLRNEFVVRVTGKVRARPAGTVNAELASGEVEVLAQAIEILNPSVPPVFQLDDEGLSENVRLENRVLDLRRPQMQKNMWLRYRTAMAVRRFLDAKGFIDIETPMLTRSTPEGARDYLVPSRVHPGEFYALPQSPQLFKQILMVAGLDRYFQVARCFRDEDLRADRQPEFTQLDMEMSFVEEDDIFRTWETVLKETFHEAMGLDIPIPFPRMSWKDAMERYGVDKPDLRFGLELVDAREWAQKCPFAVFSDAIARGDRVMGLVVPKQHEISRKDITALEEVAKSFGAKGLAWWKAGADGGVGPLARFTAGGEAAKLMQVMKAADGDLCLFIADREPITWRVLG